jgi:hypothetical protein
MPPAEAKVWFERQRQKLTLSASETQKLSAEQLFRAELTPPRTAPAGGMRKL